MVLSSWKNSAVIDLYWTLDNYSTFLLFINFISCPFSELILQIYLNPFINGNNLNS